MSRFLLSAILAVLLWCGLELRRLNQRRAIPPAPSGPWPTTIHYYVPDGTCIYVRNPDGERE
jgi:hypothetical protein